MKTPPLAALALALTLATPTGAATLLGSFQHDYGSASGRLDPPGTDALNATSVTVSDQSSGRFSDAFVFSSLEYQSIASFILTLTYSDAGPRFVDLCGYDACVPVFLEYWTVRTQGSNGAAQTDDLFSLLTGGPSQSFALSATSDVGGVNAFAQTVASQTYAFWFSEWTLGSDSFRLASARLDVYGTELPAAVPLPGGALLLLGALGGLTALRRRASRT